MWGDARVPITFMCSVELKASSLAPRLLKLFAELYHNYVIFSARIYVHKCHCTCK